MRTVSFCGLGWRFTLLELAKVQPCPILEHLAAQCTILGPDGRLASQAQIAVLNAGPSDTSGRLLYEQAASDSMRCVARDGLVPICMTGFCAAICSSEPRRPSPHSDVLGLAEGRPSSAAAGACHPRAESKGRRTQNRLQDDIH